MEMEPGVAQEPGVHDRALVGRQVVQDDVDIQLRWHILVDLVQNETKSFDVWVLPMSVITVPVAMFNAANKSRVPLRR